MPEPLARWSAALDELERSVLAAEAADDDDTPWTPPRGLGPIPAELRDRAERLAARQTAALAVLLEARANVGRHLAAVNAVPASRPQSASAFLDVTG